MGVTTGGINYAKIDNPDCSSYSKLPIKTHNVNISLDVKEPPKLKINVGPKHVSYSEFVKEGYLSLKNKPSEIQNSSIEAKDVTVTPLNNEV